MLKKLWMILIVGCLYFHTAQASADGNTLLKQCNSAISVVDTGDTSDPVGAGYCMGFVTGARYALVLITAADSQSVLKACIPDEVSNTQIARVVLNYMKNNPEKLHEHGFTLSVTALREAYPC